MTLSTKKLAILLLIAWRAAASAQSPESRLLKVEIDSLAQTLAALQTSQQLMFKRADSMAQAISRLKAKTTSPLETRSLDEAYRLSQIVADSLQDLQNRAHGLDGQLRQKAELLLKNLNAEILSLVEAKAAAKKKRETKTGERLSRELQSCRQWQRICQEILDEPPPPVLIYEVRVDPDDGARELQRKADFLRDQADRVERELRAFDQKLSALRDEAALRESMQEFSQDLALLDPANEGLRTTGSAGQNDGPRSSGLSEYLESRAAQTASPALALEPMISLSWPGNISALSEQDLRAWQKRLQQWRARRQTQADSLRRRADEIEKLGQAKEE